MARPFSSCLRFLAVCLLGTTALFAQLDPKLQQCKTDFLNLYQQSNNFAVKPEIVTIFDFSGSMEALMYHPLFVNSVSTDPTGNKMTFTLGGSNNYTITATAAGRSQCNTNIVVTAGGGVVSNAGSRSSGSYTISAITYTPTTTPFAPGATITFKATITAGSNKTVNWSVSTGGGTISTGGVWTVPALKTPNVTASVGSYSGGLLVKPDGSLVTQTDAAAASTTSGLYGASSGSSDVRNWVRAASHARFTSGGRTVDIPIPWKITDRNSVGNPLSSAKVNDPKSTHDIEMDLVYTLDGGSHVLTGNASDQTTTTLDSVTYNPAYLTWVFTGTYSSGTFSGKSVIFSSDPANLAGGQTDVAWGQGYGTYSDGAKFNNGSADVLIADHIIPARSRTQAVKEVAIRTWINYQDKVFWAFRFLDENGEANNGNATTINNNSRATITTTDPTTNYVEARDTGWTLLNSNSEGGMKRIASLGAGSYTPLTYAIARSLAQFSDSNSVFNDVEKDKDAPPQCLNHFLILFTDGQDNNGSNTSNGNTASPYLTTTTTGNAETGNAAIIASSASLLRGGNSWDVFTYAGAGAHLGDYTLTNYMTAGTYPANNTSNTPDKYLPFAIKSRAGVTFQHPHTIATMTVGVSLGGTYTTSGPKRTLFLAAALGDPNRKKWDGSDADSPDLLNLKPFTLSVPGDPTQGKTTDSVFFFDATDPKALLQSLDSAFRATGSVSNTNVTSNPNLPFIGAKLGQQVYLGKFKPPKNGGVLWSGDLLMYSTAENANGMYIVDNTGQPAATIDPSTAQWSASGLFASKLWSSRKLYTRIPKGTALVPFTDSDSGSAYSNIKAYVAKGISDDATKKAVIQYAAGGNTAGTLDSDNRPTTNRSIDGVPIMGDIINSGPAAIEYNWSDVEGSLPSSLTSGMDGLPAGTKKHFRLILVGTNQGWLHAFGEVSYQTMVADTTDETKFYQVTKGKVDELWAFMPTDFLANLDSIKVANNPHRFMVDGTPTIYHLDLPPSSGGGMGNGVVDSSERAIAIFGLKKGGRSYYALDIHDPLTPALRWAVVPDETPTLTPANTAVVSSDVASAVVKNMGFSTCTPALGRVMFNGLVKDAVFLGGGYSTDETDAQYLGTDGKPIPLGRSVLALDVYTGTVLSAKDMTANAGGPIAAGLVPFEFFLNSGMAQRAYFLDFKGGLWCWSSGATSNGGDADLFNGYRTDTSDLAKWSSSGDVGAPYVRKVAQDGTTTSALYSTLPAPFRVGYFPGAPLTSGKATPAVVGVAMVSGDRNNPVDQLYTSSTSPSQHRLTVVFDRQDNATTITDSNLYHVTDNNPNADAIKPGTDTFYLAPTAGNPAMGYYINFPAKDNATGYISKGITSPMIVGGSLFYSYFSPQTSDPCNGGSGETSTWIVCDAIKPVNNDSTTTGAACISKLGATWAGVASELTSLGTRGVIQGGVVAAAGAPAGSDQMKMELKTLLGLSRNRYPKARVWRTIH